MWRRISYRVGNDMQHNEVISQSIVLDRCQFMIFMNVEQQYIRV